MMIEETIERVEQLYLALTGAQPPLTDGKRIPPNIDPLVHVEEQLGKIAAAAERLVPSPTPTPEVTTTPAWTPRAMVWNHELELVIAIDIPGVARDQVRIAVEPHAITVKGTRPAPWSPRLRSIVVGDAPMSGFVRTFPLSAPVSPERITARLVDGVLTITVQNDGQQQSS